MRMIKMTNKFRIWLILFILINLAVFAGEKATDLMSQAIKSKSAGNISNAIIQLKKAIQASNNSMQKSLALFMLGDCQIEMNHLTNAAKTFNQLLDSVKTSDEKAEALYRLLQVETMRNRKKAAQKYFSKLKNTHRHSPYFELAESFLKARGIAASVNQVTSSRTNSSPQTTHKKVASKAIPQKKVITFSKTAPVQKTIKKPDKEKPDPEKTTVAATPKPQSDKKSQSETKQSLSPQKAALLKQSLNIGSSSNKEALIPQILSLQDGLKKNQGSENADKILFELAGKTAQFGETLEACKLYDRLLNEYPSSSYVEKAYYQAIRLRAILGVHQAVLSWSGAFLAAFPGSEYTDNIKALMFYSKHQGKVNLSNAAPLPADSVSTTSSAKNDQSTALKKDSRYIQATRKMKDGKYNLALADLNLLEQDYSQASQLWWDKALIYVQSEKFSDAEIAVKKMLRIDPKSEEGNSLLGYIQYRLEDYHGAAGSYDRAGESKGQGVNFFDGKRAAERLKKSTERR